MAHYQCKGVEFVDKVKEKAKKAGTYALNKAGDFVSATSDLMDSNPNFTQQLLSPLFGGGHKKHHRRR